MRKYSLNDNYFSEIKHPEQYYFLGFLMADGYNNEKRNCIELTLKDKDILIKLSYLIESNKPIRIKNGYYNVEWNSKTISQDLKRLGCHQGKTYDLKFPKIDKENISHFLRGYFDGDGCISEAKGVRKNGKRYRNVVVTFTSTLNFCVEIGNILKKDLNINSSILCRHPENNNSIRTLQISGTNQVFKLMSFLYKNSSIEMARKLEKFNKIYK
jgi:intein/homing endonuclease